MKAWRQPTADAIDHLTLREEEVSRPARGQVLVRMRAAVGDRVAAVRPPPG